MPNYQSIYSYVAATGEEVNLWVGEESYTVWRNRYIETGELQALFNMIDAVRLDHEYYD